ncbi:MAG TPA: ATP-binding protein [Spirochaetia bacterium]|nr:ATP-binding protein [Spirochaetia bacterium]HBI37309.1 ATP-binding protein [Spirochaetia bacterium]
MVKNSIKPNVLFMCGPAGSGKTTYAKKLECEGFLRLSFDEESYKLGITKHPLSKEMHQEIESKLIKILKENIANGIDVVLDFSFWSKKMRDKYRDILKEYNIEPKIIVIKTPKDILIERIQKRNGSNADEIMLTTDDTEKYYDNFEFPTEDEGELIIINGF